ncbi:hypothetical protein BLNAU_23589 [Blattamonas nauphoetae]|uniref:Uncharacterized protein n=1 Tax=Blattamonas nauphoetae TaxID=2049346 RepID=A0ABQ9WPT1_9EUKA|nr:hypothetical protein BLNAU_23589 [Blattamonas nauphoetae]
MGFNPLSERQALPHLRKHPSRKNYLKAQKLIQQATIGYPHFFNQWTIFSIEKELDDMVEAERMKMNDDPMQGLGMNDGDKGGGTAGAQAKLETTKMILLAVLNFLDQPSYSVDRLHRLALMALSKMMRTVVVDLLNDDTAKDGLDSIITKLEKKATAKKANEHQTLFVGEENERLLQFEVSAKTVHSTTKQFQILKHTSQMSAVVLTHDLFEHLAAPTLSVVSERQKRVQEGRGLHCGVSQSVDCVAILVDEHESLLGEIVGEADDVALPDEPAERLGIVRHGHTDELGAADQGERHAIGDKATKDGAGAAPSSRRVQHGDTRLLPAKRGERARSDSRMDGDICGAGQRAGVAGVEHRTADHSASSGTDAEQARNMNDMLC